MYFTQDSFRRFYATLIVRETQDTKLAIRQLRHSKIEMTFGVYLEVKAGDAERLVSIIDNPEVTQLYVLRPGRQRRRTAEQ